MEDLGDPPTTAYWLAWATAFLLIIATVSAGVMNVTDDGSQAGFVTAAGQTSATVDVSSTTTLPADPPAETPTTRQPTTPTSTTVPKAAAAVLRAIGTTAPPTSRAPATTSTVPPVTAPPTTAPTPSTTTSSTLPPKATVTVENNYTQAFEITVNGRTFTLGAGPDSEPQTGEIDARPPNVIDEISGRAVGEPPCQVGGVGNLFQDGGDYSITIVPGGRCARLNVIAV